MHSLFEWDDNKAARSFRLIQARNIIKNLNITITKPEDRVVHVRAVQGEGEYKQLSVLAKDVDQWAIALEAAMDQVRAAERTVAAMKRVAGESGDRIAMLTLVAQSLKTANTALLKVA